MKIVRAEHLGMCFGVRDAITLTQAHAETRPVTVLGDLVHNETVLADLRSRGVAIRHDPADIATPNVIITAHGASQRRIQAVRDLGFQVTEATCPLVHRAHQALAGLVRQGYHPIVIGQRGHVEVRGLVEDHPGCDVVLNESEIAALTFRPQMGIVSQTTQPVSRVRHLVELIRKQFPATEVQWIDTVCRPTKERQAAAETLAAQCDVVVVIGGALSNNTRELAATARQFCPRVHQIQGVDELRSEWFCNADVVGLTAGTSTPDSTIEAVQAALSKLASYQERTDWEVAA